MEDEAIKLTPEAQLRDQTQQTGWISRLSAKTGGNLR
jgi:hypothetical protein